MRSYIHVVIVVKGEQEHLPMNGKIGTVSAILFANVADVDPKLPHRGRDTVLPSGTETKSKIIH